MVRLGTRRSELPMTSYLAVRFCSLLRTLVGVLRTAVDYFSVNSSKTTIVYLKLRFLYSCLDTAFIL